MEREHFGHICLRIWSTAVGRPLLTVMIVAAGSIGLQSAIVMSPYLQALTENSVVVMVECDSTEAVIVEFGPTAEYGSQFQTQSWQVTTAVLPTYVHRVMLTGLIADSIYHYRASQAASVSGDACFRTAVPAGTGFQFAWLADCRTGIAVHDLIAGLILAASPRFSIYGGDLCLDGSYESWKGEFFRSAELALTATVPFFIAPGNHEGWSINTIAFTQLGGAGDPASGYGSFDCGDLHVLVLNNMVPFTAGSAQYAFAQADLAGSTCTWKVVVSHYPAYSAGGHGENAEMIALTRDVFIPAGVQLVLSGHSHFYQHNWVDGIHHLVVGSAGAPLKPTAYALYTVNAFSEYNFALVQVTSAQVVVDVRNERNQLLETIILANPWPDPADTDGDSEVTASDLTALAGYLGGNTTACAAGAGSICREDGATAADLVCLVCRLAFSTGPNTDQARR